MNWWLPGREGERNDDKRGDEEKRETKAKRIPITHTLALTTVGQTYSNISDFKLSDNIVFVGSL